MSCPHGQVLSSHYGSRSRHVDRGIRFCCLHAIGQLTPLQPFDDLVVDAVDRRGDVLVGDTHRRRTSALTSIVLQNSL